MSLDEVLALVTEETTTISGVITLIENLRTEVGNLLSGAEVPPAVQEKVDALFAAVTANKSTLDTALAANV